MAHINRKYIDSHWMLFIARGLIALAFGAVSLFNMKRDVPYMITVVGIFLLTFSIVEFVNALYRARQKTGWAISVSLAIIDAVVALALLFTITQDSTWHLYIISIYTFLRGFFEIIAGFRATVDPTDRFTWVFSGMFGAISGVTIFSSAVLNQNDYFVRFFGVYLLIIGTCSLFYGVHNRAQKIEDRVARRESAAKAAKTRKHNGRAGKKIVKRSK
ncbi:DUF308 domain-containing protein [Candidatus Saccharibacteria bacterium]|nr:DUF308 domain-containing protein [Candidatus Saccharibacteria bacterium]